MTDGRSARTLVLFFTFGVSLAVWRETGVLEREVALYDALGEEFDQIYFLTYGGEPDRAIAEELPPHVNVVPKRLVSNDFLYSLLLPLIHRRIVAEADLLKTNQMLGSWAAVLASVLYRVPLVVRTGYVLSIFYERKGRRWTLRFLARALEHVAYRAADGVITSSQAGYDYVEDRYAPSGRHEMIPNYIETDVFRPMDVEKRPNSVCFVGRLAPQKNLHSLFDALAGTDCHLTVVGSGPMENELARRADDLALDVTFRENVPNHDLPELLNRHEIFVLPSHYEGMPKALLEAMACGVAVVGTDVMGIREVVADGETGVLCDTGAESIREAVLSLIAASDLRERLGRAARREIVANYSLEEVTARESWLYHALL